MVECLKNISENILELTNINHSFSIKISILNQYITCLEQLKSKKVNFSNETISFVKKLHCCLVEMIGF